MAAAAISEANPAVTGLPDPEGPPAPKRVGLFGGSFDPPHLGHLVAAREVADRLGLDRVLLVPAALPPHKTGDRAPATPGELRLAMLRAAVGEDPVLRPSGMELERGGVSWTVDTLRALHEEWPGAALHLVMGADQWEGFPRWREPHAMAELATLVVMTREGAGIGGGAAGAPGTADPSAGAAFAGDLLEVPVPRIDISSSDIRRRVREGRSIRDLVPDGVRRIIEESKLYSDEP